MPLIRVATRIDKIQHVTLAIYEQPKPFLRWAGGKRKLTNLIQSLFPVDYDGNQNRFYEPFVGGGAMMIALGNTESKTFTPGKNLHIGDLNPDLVATYQVIRDDLSNLITRLKKMPIKVNLDVYNEVRNSKPRSPAGRATRFIFLNKTCFNGLWRVNGSGEFNVPWGKITEPQLFTLENMRSLNHRLQGSEILHAAYQETLKSAKDRDIVYLDPPYIPLSISSSFSQYSRENFGLADHLRLNSEIKKLTSQGVRVIMSNSDTPETREIYGNSLSLFRLSVSRSISGQSHGRSSVQEIIGVNFPIQINEQSKALQKIR